MAQIREIKKRIKSVANTQKVTHAMELVSAAKMRKAQLAATSSRPYSLGLHSILKTISASPINHPLATPKEGGKDYIILVTSDRGLAGSLNINLFREILRQDIKNPAFITVGKKAMNFASKSGSDLIASFGSEEVSTLELARTLSKLISAAYTSGEARSVNAIYPKFGSTVSQIPTWEKLLPIEVREQTEQTPNGTLLFEPTIEEIVNVILPHHILTTIYQILLEAKASEHSARMVAMKNATDAADDLIDDLTITYNQARQEAITKELLDIVTAQKAFE